MDIVTRCLFLLSLVAILGAIILGFLFIAKKIDKTPSNETPKIPFKPTLSHEDVINIVSWCINVSFEKRKALVYDLNSMRYYRIEEELEILSKEIYANIGKGTQENFAYYFSEDYLMRFVIQNVELLLIADLKSRQK